MYKKTKHKPLIYLKNSYSRELTAPSKMMLLLGLMVASVLTVYPLHLPLLFFRPNFLFLLVVYAVVQYPKRYGIWHLFLIGFVTDVLAAQVLGINALLFPLSYYVVTLLFGADELRPLHKIYKAGLAWTVYSVLLGLSWLIFGSFEPWNALWALPLGFLALLVIFVVQSPRLK